MAPREPRQSVGSVASQLGIEVGAGAAATGAPAAATATAIAVSATAVAKATHAVLKAMVIHDRKRLADDGAWIYAALLQQYPGQVTTIQTVVTNERKREEEFQRKRRERLAQELPKAFADPNAQRRAGRVNAIMERERRYEDMRSQAVMDRAQGRMDLENLRILSPNVVFWYLDPNVKKHTLDCLVMGNKLWPFHVVENIHPPLHPGCPCQLLGEDEATDLGYMRRGTRKVSAAGVVKAMEDFKRAHALEHALPREEVESFLTALLEGQERPEEATVSRLAGAALLDLLDEATWKASLHPRNRRGQFRKTDFNSMAQDFLNPETKDGLAEDQAITRYVDGWNGRINNMLRNRARGIKEEDPEVEELVEQMDKAIDHKGVELTGSPVYRGLDAAGHPAILEAIKTNGSFTEASFTSTTGVLQVARNFAEHRLRPEVPAVLVIHTPKGTKALRYSKLNEAERILPRGGTFQVTGSRDWTQYGHSVLWVDVEWTPPQ